MVTHDLRMVQYVDKVIQMVDGKIAQVMEDPQAIAELAGTSGFESAVDRPAPVPAPNGQVVYAPGFTRLAPVPAAGD